MDNIDKHETADSAPVEGPEEPKSDARHVVDFSDIAESTKPNSSTRETDGYFIQMG